MASFEQKYYESDAFWSGSMLLDADNQVRIQETAKIIPQDATTLLDVGCGNGVFCNYLLEQRKDLILTGMDRSEQALSYVKVEKKIGEITNIPFENNTFDVVTCLQVLEHLSINDFEAAMKELCRVSRKYVVIGVPFMENREKNYTKCPKCLTIFNSDLHLKDFSNEDILHLTDMNGFKFLKSVNVVEKKIPIGYEYLQKLSFSKKTKMPEFNSPICPLCGFENEKYGQINIPNVVNAETINNSSITRKIWQSVKDIWPKKTKSGYLIMALYVKN